VAAGNTTLDGASLARLKAGRNAMTRLNLALADLDGAKTKATSAGWTREAGRLSTLTGELTELLGKMRERYEVDRHRASS
jgi:hypothetical protein